MTKLMMDRNEAIEMAELFRAIGGFSKVEVDHHGFVSKLTPEIEMDGNWKVDLWCVNAESGNRNLESVWNYEPKMAKAIARKAKGKATKRDHQAFSRAAAERELD